MTKRLLPPVEADRVRLRLLEQGDLPLTLAWRNRDDIRRWFFTCDLITLDQHLAWFQHYQERDDDFVFIIEETVPARRPVGQVAVYHIAWEQRRAEFGRLMIGEPDAAGRGLARAATQLMLHVAFGSLGLQEIYLEVFADNAPALAVYRACGFEIAGRPRDNVLTMVKRSES